MMKSIASLLLLAVSVTSFTAPQPVLTTTSSTALNMGLFDAFKPKPKEPEKIGGMDANIFGGKGKKVTVREDEDNDMWIEDDKGGRKKAN